MLRLDLLLKLGLAVLLGGVIGLEREISGKPAGLRTNILICVGAALLTDVSIRIVGGPGGGDPSRLAAQIITGIGFIGAGTIMQSSGTITGLTSAATIWVVCAIGITVGAGFFLEAVGAGLVVALVLSGLGTVEHDELVPLAIVVYGHAPLLIVVTGRQIVLRPGTTLDRFCLHVFDVRYRLYGAFLYESAPNHGLRRVRV